MLEILCKMHDFALIVVPVTSSFLTHFIASNIYSFVCTPLTLWGVLQSIIVTASPVCSTILSVMNYTQNMYGSLLLGMGAYLIKVLASRSCEHSEKN